MKNLGINSLRFNNNDVMNNIEGVLEEITSNLQEKSKSSMTSFYTYFLI